MSKDKVKKQKVKRKPIVEKHTKADGREEYYISKAPQKTIGGKIIIWILVVLMGLASLGGLIVAFIELAK